MGYNLAAWSSVLVPKEKGVLVYKTCICRNEALLLKQLDKFYNKKDVLWIHLV
jgi:hypothetical protein